MKTDTSHLNIWHTGCLCGWPHCWWGQYLMLCGYSSSSVFPSYKAMNFISFSSHSTVLFSSMPPSVTVKSGFQIFLQNVLTCGDRLRGRQQRLISWMESDVIKKHFGNCRWSQLGARWCLRGAGNCHCLPGNFTCLAFLKASKHTCSLVPPWLTDVLIV